MQHYFINSDSLMDPFYFEEKKNNYLQLASREKSVRKLLYELSELLEELITKSSEIIREAYISEILPNFILLLEKYSSYGIAPNKTQKIISIADRLEKYVDQEELQTKLIHSVLRIKSELSGLEKILTGEIVKNTSGSLSFPALEQTPNPEEKYGVLEELEISINSNKKSNKVEFLIVPSLPQLDEKLYAQIQRSWNYAVNYLKSRYKRYKPNLQVTIKFVNNRGIYEGNSLGIVLTIGFIQELFRYYDLREDISYEDDISATGSMSKEGEINEVGNDIIRIKTETVFYSGVEKFIVPQNDYQDAKGKLAELLSKYPERKLEIIPAINVKDVITRRDTLKIKQQNIITWGGRGVLRNKVAVISMTILIGVIIGFYYVNQDNNPHHFRYSINGITIYNKFNSVIWSKKRQMNQKIIDSPEYLLNQAMIIDVDNDSKNEVLLTQIDEGPRGAFSLFNYNGDLIWQYIHIDSIANEEEVFDGIFSGKTIIDTIRNKTDIEIIVNVQHHHYYPSGIFKLDARTGKRISNILWHPGGITCSMVADIDQDGKKEIICGGISNNIKKAVLFSIEHDKLLGTFPTNKKIPFKNMKLSEFENYLTFSQTDYGKLVFPKYNRIYYPFRLLNDILEIRVIEGKTLLEKEFEYSVFLSNNFIPMYIVIGDIHIINRDKLIREGRLNQPYSNTREFRNSILDQIEYWDGEKFAKFSNY